MDVTEGRIDKPNVNEYNLDFLFTLSLNSALREIHVRHYDRLMSKSKSIYVDNF